MSTILKALRRLEEDQPAEPEAAANTTDAAAAPSTEDLRGRILAEERANQLVREAARDAAAGDAEDADPSDSMPAPLLRHAPLAAAGLVALVIGVMVIPALLDSPDVPPPTGSEEAVSVARAPVASPAPADPPPRVEGRHQQPIAKERLIAVRQRVAKHDTLDVRR